MKEEELVTLLKVSQELAATLDLQRVLQTTTDRISELGDFKTAAVYLFEGDTLRLRTTTPPLPPQFPEELRNALLADHPHIRKAIASGAPVFLHDAATAALTPAEKAVVEMRSLRSILYLPLMAGAKVMGALIAATTAGPRMLSEAEIDVSCAVANMAALAVENALLYESTQRHAIELGQNIVQLRENERQLKSTKERYDFATGVGKVGTWDWNPVTGDLIWNDETFRILGFEPGSISPSYGLFMERVHPDDRQRLDSAVQAVLHEKRPYSLDCRVVLRNGVERICHVRGKVEFDENDRPIRMLGTFQDITERKKVEDALRESEARYRSMFESNPHPMWVFDLETLRFLAVNDAAIAHYGYSREQFLGMTIEDIRPAEDIPRLMQNLNHPVEAGIDEAGIWRHRKQDGTLIDVEITSHRLDFGGRTAELVLANDVTERRQAEERIRKLAHFDSLTGLPNRSLLADRVSQAISMAQRSHGTLAVLFVDLDHFKNINDTLGHRIGDELLREIARRLQSAVRDEDTVSRLGGDEFILLLPGTDTNGAAHVSRKLLHAVAQHYQIENHELVITPSIGIAMHPSDGEDFDALSKCADIAMYRAKRDGRNNYRFFTPEMQARSARNLQLENALRRALEREQLHLHYQPQVSLQDGSIVGAEALLRWRHPALGMVSPAEFIPVAEDSGLILPIGEWVLRTAIRQLREWMDSGIPPMTVAVNLSAVQFRQPKLVKLVTQILKEEGLPPQHLELELTEGVTMNDPVTAVKVMDSLHGRGIRLSIDDFGTGYSSLSQLKRFQIHKLKIDQSFVRDVVEDQDDKAIVKAIINMASGLDVRTIAEGVETKEQLEFLQENGCNEIQGFHYSKPLAADEFALFVRGIGR